MRKSSTRCARSSRCLTHEVGLSGEALCGSWLDDPGSAVAARAPRRGGVAPLRHARVLSILHNPFYAGAYVYGRTQTRQRPCRAKRPASRATPPGQARDWPTLLKDHHPGYISWSQFRRNQDQLDDNRTFDPDQHRGAVREGGALLQGIVGCGVCGRRMTVRYMPDGIRPIYVCAQVHKDFAGKTCQFMRGDGIDAAVAQLLLEAIEPAQLTIALEAVEHLEAQAQAIERQWQLRLERAATRPIGPGAAIWQWNPNTDWWRGVWNATGMRS